MQLTGIEIAPEAIACANQSAAELGLTRLQFQALDSTQFATAQGKCLSWCWLTRRDVALVNRYVIISQRWHRVLSSTPAVTPKPWRKISAKLPGYRIERVQLFDMFPHTAHYEVLTLLVQQ